MKNITTIEMNYENIEQKVRNNNPYPKPHFSYFHRKNPFDNGSCLKNISTIFGNSKCCWLLPTNPNFVKQRPKYLQEYPFVDI